MPRPGKQAPARIASPAGGRTVSSLENFPESQSFEWVARAMGAPVAIGETNPLVQAGGALFLAAETAADFQKIKNTKTLQIFPWGELD